MCRKYCWLHWIFHIRWLMVAPRIACPYCGSMHRRKPHLDMTEECWLMQRPITGMEIHNATHRG